MKNPSFDPKSLPTCALRAPHKSKAKALFSRKKLAAAITAQVLFCGSAFAGPTGGVVTGGQGTIEQVGTETTINQDTDRLSIDWDSFNVDVNERVEFIQPSQSSIALNNILGTNGSQILGQIDANGHVVLVNPNGIYFGQSATVNVGGLIASGLQINPEDFINGDLVFEGLEGTDGAVINTGLINASLGGNVTLLGKAVENRGLIMANMGRVNLVAGEEIILTFDQQGMLGVQVSEALLKDELEGSDDEDNETVKNSGEIRAENGQILLSAAKAQEVFSQAVNPGAKTATSVVYHDDGTFTLGAGSDVINTGTLDVSSEVNAGEVVVLGENISNEGAILANTQNGIAGNIELHSNTTTDLKNTGSLQANAKLSGQGGDIKLQGTNVGLFDETSVTAEGANGGGQILVGGDREGLNPQIKNAEFVYVGENTQISTNATKDGDGGKLITFAEDTTRIYGQLSSTGGNESGDGGFIETSGKKGFQILTTPNISSANGKGGHWLIDPYDIAIVSGGFSDTNMDSDPFESTDEGASLRVSTIESALNVGGIVTIQTGAGDGSENELGNITFSENVELSSDVKSTLNLIAHNNIEINRSIIAGAKNPDRSLNIHLEANRSGGTGSIIIDNNVTIDTNGGDFKIGDISTDGSSIDTTISGAFDVEFGNATIDLTDANYSGSQLDDYFPGRTDGPEGLAPSGSLAINASHDVELGEVIIKGRDVDESTYKIDVVAGGSITLAQGFTYDNNPTEDFESNNAINNRSFSTLSLTAGDNIVFEGDVDRDFADDTRREHQDRLNIRLQSNTNGNAVDSGLGDIIFGTSPGNIEVLTAGGDLTILGAANVDWQGDVFDVSSAFGPGTVSITTSGDITTGAIKTEFDAVTGEVNGAQTLRVMSVLLNAGENLSLTDNISTNSGSITLSGNNINLNNATLDSSRIGGPFGDETGDITLTTSSSLALNTINVLGDFSLIVTNPVLDVDNPPSAVNISQSGSSSLTVDGGVIVNTQNANVLLDQSNTIANPIVVNVSADSLLVDAGDFSLSNGANEGIQIDSLNIAGDLFLNANSGDINNTNASAGEVRVGGTTELRSDGDIILSHSDNVFSGAVFFTDSGSSLDAVTLVNDGALSIGRDGEVSELSDELNVTARGAITQVDGSILEMPEDENTVSSFTAQSEDGQTRFDVTLNEDNRIEVLDLIAANATISNDRTFYLNDIDVSGVFSVTTTDGGGTGSLRQTSNPDITINELVLSVFGDAELGGSGNRNIQSLSGSAGSLTLQTSSTLTLKDFAIGADSNIVSQGVIVAENAVLSHTNPDATSGELEVDASSAHVELSNNFSFEDGIDLDIKNAASLNFDANVTQENSTSSTLSVDANFSDNTFTIGNAAEHSINRVILSGNTGEGDVLVGPSGGADWALPSSENPNMSVNGSDFFFTGFESVEAGDGADAFEINQDLDIQLNGNGGTDTFTLVDNFAEVTIDGGAGSDVLQTTAGDNVWSLAAGTLGNGSDVAIFTGFEDLRGGGDSNSLSGESVATAWVINSGTGTTNDGTLTYNNGAEQTISFTGFDELVGGSGVDTFNLNATALTVELDGGGGRDVLNALETQAHTWSVNDAIGSLVNGSETQTVTFENIETLNGSETAIDTVSFSGSPNLNVIINAGDGAGVSDEVSYAGVDSELDLTVSLGVGGLNGFEQVTGNNGDLVLQASETQSTAWTVTGANSGSVSVAGADAITFINFANLLGGSAADTFTFNANVSESVRGGDGADVFNINTSVSGSLDAGADNDIFNIGALGIAAIIDGGDDNDILNTFAGDERAWAIDTDGGTFTNVNDADSEEIAFSNIETLEGSATDTDTVNFSVIPNVNVIINAGNADGVVDVISYAGVNTNTTATVGLGVGGLNGFEQVTGNNGNLILQSSTDQASTWTITSANSGSVVVGTDTTLFTNFANLLGSSAQDSFTINANVSESVRGGDGADVFNINSTLTADIDAGAGNDTFNIGALGIAASIDGGDDNDILNTFAGDDREWAIDNNGGTFTNVNDADSEEIAFSNIETLEGSAADVDTVLFSAIPTLTLTMNAGNAEGVVDVISYAGVSSGTTATVGLGAGGLNGFEQVTGNNGELILQSSVDQASTWNVTSTNSGTVSVGGVSTTFTDFANLLGSSAADEFNLGANVSGSVSGDAGADTFNFNANVSGTTEGGAGADVFNIANTVTGNISGDGAADTFSINAANINASIDGGAGTDIVNAFAGVDHDWAINESNVVLSDAGTTNAINLSALETLNGTAADVDTAIFDSVPDSLNVTLEAGNADGMVDVISYAGVGASASAIVGLGVAGLNGFEQVTGNNGALVLQASETEATTWSITATNSGSVSVDGAEPMLFTNFAHLLGGSASDVFTLAANVTDSVSGDAGADTFNFNANVSGTIEGGAGADVFNIANTVTGNISGDGAADTFNINAANINASIDGGAGTDIVNAFAGVDHDWAINNSNVVLSDAGTTNAINLSALETLNGTAADVDTAIFDSVPDSLNVTLNAGNADGVVDVVSYADVNVNAAEFVDVSNANLIGFEHIRGNNGNLTLRNNTADNANWSVTTNNAGILELPASNLAFSGFAHLQGGTGNDNFLLNALVSSIVGGDGSNTLDSSGVATELSIGLDLSAGADINTEDLSTISANATQANRLISQESASWTISGRNSGTQTNTSASTTSTFSGFTHLQGLNGDHDFTLLASAELINPATSATGTVSGGSGSNTLTTSNAVDNTWTLSAANDGSLTKADTSLGFENIQSLAGGTATDTLNALDTDNAWSLNADFAGALNGVLAFSGFEVLNGGAGIDTVTLGSGVEHGSINTGDGDDALTLNSNALVQGIDTGEGNDSVTFDGYDQLLVAIEPTALSTDMEVLNTETISASNGSDDQLQGLASAANDWAITSENAGTLNGLSFDGFDVLLGGSAEDVFSFSGNEAVLNSVSITAGADPENLVTDTWDASGIDDTVDISIDLNDSVVSEFEHFVGNGANSTLTGLNAEASWQVNSANAGQITYADSEKSFDAFATLIGGSDIDTFALSALVSEIDGGAGDDRVDFSGYAGELSVALNEITSEDILLRNVVNVTANAQHRNELLSVATDNDWTISGENAGILESDGDFIAFAGFSFLRGTENNDFSIQNDGVLSYGTDLASLGGVTGGSGDNTLSATVGDNSNWHITGEDSGHVDITDAGVTRQLNFFSVESLQGGVSRDQFSIDNLSASIESVDGGAGVNALKARDEVDNDWQITGSHAGTVERVGDFSNIQTLIGGNQNDSFTLSANATISLLDGGEGNNSVDLENVTSSTNVFIGSEVRGTAGLPGITVNNIQNLKAPNILGNALYASNEQDNTWRVNSATGGQINNELTYQNVSQLVGGDGNDTFHLDAHNFELSVDGGLGTNRISVADTGGNDNNWVFSAFDTGTLNGATDFTRVRSFTGDSEEDVFDFSAVAANSSNVLETDPDNILDLIDGGAGEDTILGYNTVNSWNINDENAGTLRSTTFKISVGFANIENLTGGLQGDTFSLSGFGYVDGLIDGGSEGNALSAGFYEGNRQIQLLESVDDFREGEFINIINVDNTVGSGEIVGLNKRNVWLITGEDAGFYVRTNDGDELFTLDPKQWSFDYDAASGVISEGSTGKEYSVFEFADIISLTGGGDQDTFIFLEGGSLTEALNGGDGNDTLQLGYHNTTHTWTIQGENAGQLLAGAPDSDTQTLSVFDSIENLIGSDTVDYFRFEDVGAEAAVTPSLAGINGKGGADRIDLLSLDAQHIQLGSDASSIEVLRESGAIQIAAAIKHVETIHTGAGDDVVQVLGLGDVLQINTGEGRNTLSSALWTTADVAIHLGNQTLSANDQELSFTNIESFAANENTESRLIGLEQNATWQLHDNYSGSASFTQVGADDVERVTSYTFEGFQNLFGSSASDTFELAGFQIGGVDGAEGANTLSTGGLVDASYDWQIHAADAGQVNVVNAGAEGAATEAWQFDFANVQTLSAGASNDHFTFASTGSVSGLIDAGAGVDQVSYLEGASDWQVNGNTLESPTTFSVAGAENASARFASVEAINASSTHRASLRAADTANTWTFQGAGSGQLISENANQNQSALQFNNFNHFIGGAAKDRFVIENMEHLRAVDGWIEGGSGDVGVIDSVLITDTTADRSLGLMAYSPDLQNTTPVDAFVTNVELLESDGLNSLYGASAAGLEYRWVVDGIYQGTLTYDNGDPVEIAFEGFNKIFAGDSNDSFRIDADNFMDFVSGGDGEGRDSIDFSEVTDNQVIIVDNTDSNIGVVGIEGFIGNNNGEDKTTYQSTLRVANQSGDEGELHSNTWTVTGTNSGSFVQDDGKIISFRGFNHLLGGKGDDSFAIEQGGNITGSIRGADNGPVTGEDSLTLTSTDPFTLALLDSAAHPPALNALTVEDQLLLANIDSIVGNGRNTTLVGAAIDNDWRFDGQDKGYVRYSSGGIKTINFETVANIQGGTESDDFIFNAGDRLSGWLSGGEGVDSLTLNFDQAPVTVAVADKAQTQLGEAEVHVRNDIESIEGESTQSTTALYTLVGASSANNTWQINGANAGLVNGVAFSGFDSLLGNARADSFQLVEGGLLTGVMDGAAGVNTLDAQALQSNLSVAIGTNHTLANPQVQIANIQNISANKANTNTLAGANEATTWTVSAANAGDLNGLVNFTGFVNLIGGSAQDAFVFTESGALSGYIDGGDHPVGSRDRVDYSQLAGDVKVRLADRGENGVEISGADQTASVIDIELIKGNATGFGNTQQDTVLIANHYDNTWAIEAVEVDGVQSDAVNDGRLVSGASDIAFVDFNQLQGGNRVDVFNQNAGSVSGQVRGGEGNDVFHLSSSQSVESTYYGDAGNDTFNYTLALNSGSTRTHLYGGEGSDSVLITGGDTSLNANYSPTSTGTAILAYQHQQGESIVAQAVNFSDVETVQQGANVHSLNIGGNSETAIDHFYLSDGAFRVNDHTEVSYGVSTPRVNVEAISDDVIHIEQSFSVLDTLTLKEGRLSIDDPEAVIETTSLVLNGVSLLEDEEGTDSTLALLTNITNLSVNNIENSLTIAQQSLQPSPLILQDITHVSGSLSIQQSSGNVQQGEGASLGVDGSLSIAANNGSIRVNNESNDISGENASVRLIASNGDIDFANRSDVTLSELVTQNLTLYSGGNVQASGDVRVANTANLSAEGGIQISEGNNAFSDVRISANSIELASKAEGELNILEAKATNSVSIAGDGLFITGAVDGANVSLNSGGRFDMGAESALSSGGELSVHGEQSLTVTTAITAQDDILLSSRGGLDQNAHIQSVSGDIKLNVVGDVFMSEPSQLTGESVTIEGLDGEGAGVISLSQIIASKETGKVTLKGDKVVDNQSESAATNPVEQAEERGQVNVVAHTLESSTVNGFGSSNAIETEVSVANIVNTDFVFDAIKLDNVGELDIKALWANGNIELSNEGDIYVAPGSINAFYDGRPLVNSIDEVIRSVGGGHDEAQRLRGEIGSSELVLIGQGSLRVKPDLPDTENPHISAFSSDITVTGDVGDPLDPQLVFYVPEDFNLSGDKRWKSLLWGFDLGIPKSFNEDVLLVPTIQAGEQLIVVEELDEVDPAIFTSVKNYYYNEVSIRLPRDQRWDEEEDEDI